MIKHISKLIFCAFLLFGVTSKATASDNTFKSEDYTFNLTRIASGLEFPWGIDFLPNGDILVTEREGYLNLIKNGTSTPIRISGLPDNIYVAGQGGMLDVVAHPEFKDNNLIYFSYAGRDGNVAGTEVARARLDGTQLKNVTKIFAVDMKTSGSAHYGSRLVFDREGKLYITTGDRYNFMDEAQNPNNHLGTVLRLNDDGSVPEDNPFVGMDGHKPEIFTYGHRNAQGIAMRPSEGVIWMHEHGPRGGDEVNILRAGTNYGWPAITYGIDYSGAIISEETHADGMAQPVVFWNPSIAPSGMTFYTGDDFPAWQGNIFLGALAGTHLRRLVLDGDKVVKQEVLLDDLARIRDVTMGNDGHLYILTDNLDGSIFRIDPVE